MQVPQRLAPPRGNAMVIPKAPFLLMSIRVTPVFRKRLSTLQAWGAEHVTGEQWAARAFITDIIQLSNLYRYANRRV